MAKDGIQLKVKARVTVRTNIDRLVGGATEETIIARVGEGIVNAIGSAETHKEVLENPDTHLQDGAGARASTPARRSRSSRSTSPTSTSARTSAPSCRPIQAEADKRVAQAKAEERRAIAVAKEQEMNAEVQENRAKVVEAEAEIPLAIAEAFRKGNLGIMDYYNLRNVQADTEMRNAIAGTGHGRRENSQSS